MYEFALPDLGEGVHEGEILKWYVSAGDTIGEDDPLVEVETDKAAVTIPSPVGGKVVSLSGAVGDIVHTGEIIAVIDEAASGAEAKPEPKKEPEKPKPEPKTEAAPPPKPEAKPEPTPKSQPAPAAATDRKGPVPAAPATRRLARELGVDINRVPGSGPGGRVLPEDVRRSAEGGPAAAPAAPVEKAESAAPRPAGAPTAIPYVELEPMPDFSKWGEIATEPVRSIRRKVALKMATAAAVIPHVAHGDDVDVTELDALRRSLKERYADEAGGNLTLLPFIAKAVVSALRKFPSFNASLDPDKQELVFKKYYNIGVAVDSPKGLVVPVVRGADKLSVLETSSEIVRLATAAREEKLAAQDFQGGTFTLTNIGPVGGTFATPIINYPEVAILGIFRMTERPVVRDGRIVVRKIMPLVLSFDHRVADGADAARFVNHVKAMLEEPEVMLVRA